MSLSMLFELSEDCRSAGRASRDASKNGRLRELGLGLTIGYVDMGPRAS